MPQIPFMLEFTAAVNQQKYQLTLITIIKAHINRAMMQ